MMQTRSASKLTKLTTLAILGSISLVLFFISFPLPMLPAYLKVDFSDVPALIAGLIFSPLAGVFVVFLKNILYFIFTGATDPIGVVANFVAGVLFMLPVALLFHKFRTVKSVVTGLIIGTVGMTVIMSILNYFIILPAYAFFVGMEMNETIKWTSVFAGVLPFNFIKGLIVSSLFVFLFIKLRRWIEQKYVGVA